MLCRFPSVNDCTSFCSRLVYKIRPQANLPKNNAQLTNFLLIINAILFDHQITAVQLRIGTPASYNLCMCVNFLMALIF